jgi:hypothetical protein
MQAAEQLVNDLDINGYIVACSQMNLTINDWIGLHGDPFYKMFGLPDLVKRALKSAASKANEEIRSRREEEINKISNNSLSVNRHSTMSGSSSGHMDKIFK